MIVFCSHNGREKKWKKVPFLRDLTTVNHGDSEDIKHIVSMDNFLHTLKLQHEKNDKEYRKFNITREIESRPKEILQIKGKTYLTISTILQFVFSNSADFACCARAVQGIQAVLYGGSQETVLKIYK